MAAGTKRWVARLLRVLGIMALVALALLAWGWREARRELVWLARRQPPAWVQAVSIPEVGALAVVRDSATPDSAAAPGFPDPIARAMAEYSAGHHALALVTLEAHLEQAPAETEARFYAGVAALAAGSGRRALSHLREFPAGGRYSEAARFYAAQAQLLTGRREAARRTLQQVASGPGRYRLEAAEQLEDLDALPGGWRAYWPGR